MRHFLKGSLPRPSGHDSMRFNRTPRNNSTLRWLATVFVATLIVFSCKKKEDPVPANNAASTNNQTTTTGTTGGTTTGGSTTGGSTTGGSTTGGSTTGGTSGGTTVATFGQFFHGLLTIRTLTDATTSSLKFSTESEAFFSQTPVTEITDSLGENVGTVLLNNDPLVFDQATNSYFLGTVKSLSQSKWNVTGGNTIPAFTFDASFASPVCHNPEVLPETISRSSGASIPLNLSDFTFATVLFTVKNSMMTIEAGFGFAKANGNIVISPNFLKMLGDADSATLSLILENAVNLNVNGKNIVVKKESVFKQVVQLKP